eukprot:7503859-Prorocentrum_lima.AAC.1
MKSHHLVLTNKLVVRPSILIGGQCHLPQTALTADLLDRRYLEGGQCDVKMTVRTAVGPIWLR